MKSSLNSIIYVHYILITIFYFTFLSHADIFILFWKISEENVNRILDDLVFSSLADALLQFFEQ